jgi:hypothetical protein
MLRKLLWTGVNAAMLVVARKATIKVWRVVTGEEPPVAKK